MSNSPVQVILNTSDFIEALDKPPRGSNKDFYEDKDLEYLARDGAKIPQNGIPFTAILTISDPNNEEPVFNDMRQTLQSLGVNTVDIKTATRIVPRV